MSDQPLQMGDRVRMVSTWTGEVVSIDTEEGEQTGFVLKDERTGSRIIGRFGPHMQVHVLRRPPKHWPPRPGEIWAAGQWAWSIGTGPVETTGVYCRVVGGPHDGELWDEEWVPLNGLDGLAPDFRRVWPPEATEGAADDTRTAG
jgi:hypothetical protein